MSQIKQSRARARVDRTKTVDRVKEVAAIMSRGEWTAKRALDLAQAWGVSVSRVQQISCEASRVVRGALGDEEEMRARVLSFLDEVGARALAGGELGEATRAAKVFGDIAGLVVQRVDATVRAASMTDEELEAEILREADRIRKKKGAA